MCLLSFLFHRNNYNVFKAAAEKVFIFLRACDSTNAISNTLLQPPPENRIIISFRFCARVNNVLDRLRFFGSFGAEIFTEVNRFLLLLFFLI